MSFVPVFVRSGNNYDMGKVSDETGLRCEDPSLTQQQFAEECDINTIVDRFMKSGVLPSPVNMPAYQDYDGIFDYQSAMNTIREADLAFMSLDARVRARFNNSPQAFLEFFADPANAEEGVRLGLVIPKPSVKQEEPGGANPLPDAA